MALPAAQRPEDWAWISPVGQGIEVNYLNGNPYYLTAEEWNNFTARINLFRSYVGLSVITFTMAVKGQPMTASQANEAVRAISEMNPPIAIPGAVVDASLKLVDSSDNILTDIEDKILYANAVKNVNVVGSGSPITAQFINDLKHALNSIQSIEYKLADINGTVLTDIDNKVLSCISPV